MDKEYGKCCYLKCPGAGLTGKIRSDTISIECKNGSYQEIHEDCLADMIEKNPKLRERFNNSFIINP